MSVSLRHDGSSTVLFLVGICNRRAASWKKRCTRETAVEAGSALWRLAREVTINHKYQSSASIMLLNKYPPLQHSPYYALTLPFVEAPKRGSEWQ
jgi:hypothetical protein